MKNKNSTLNKNKIMLRIRNKNKKNTRKKNRYIKRGGKDVVIKRKTNIKNNPKNHVEVISGIKETSLPLSEQNQIDVDNEPLNNTQQNIIGGEPKTTTETSKDKKFVIVRISLPDGNIMDLQGDTSNTIEESIQQFKEENKPIEKKSDINVSEINSQLKEIQETIKELSEKMAQLLTLGATEDLSKVVSTPRLTSDEEGFPSITTTEPLTTTTEPLTTTTEPLTTTTEPLTTTTEPLTTTTEPLTTTTEPLTTTTEQLTTRTEPGFPEIQ